jgi:predicted nuclease with TOPRIM domain
MTENIVQIVLAVIGSGVLTSIVTAFIGKRKYDAEVDELRQQIEAANTDNQIKIDEHIQAQFMELAETYKAETAARKQEMEELRRQNNELIDQQNQFRTQITDLENQIHKLMTWVTYDMLSYQSELEQELLRLNPDVKLPSYRKPPKFVQEFINAELASHNEEEPNHESETETE